MTILGKNTIRYSLFAAAVVLLFTLTGIFTKFALREVIPGQLRLDVVLLVLMSGVPALIIAAGLRQRGWVAQCVNGAIAGLVVALTLSLVVLWEQGSDIANIIFYFANYQPLAGSTVTLGYSGAETVFPGLFLLLIFCGMVGTISGGFMRLAPRIQRLVLISLLLTLVISLLENQIRNVISLPDVVALSVAFVLGYAASRYIKGEANLYRQLGIGFISGAAAGLVIALLIGAGAIAAGGLFFNEDASHRILTAYENPLLPFIVFFGVVGAVGGLAALSRSLVHDALFFLLTGLIVIGLLNAQGSMSLLIALISLGLLAGVQFFLPAFSQESQRRFEQVSRVEQRMGGRMAAALGLGLLLVAPSFLGQYITNVLDLVALYIVMGIGLNVMVGYAGLLDLGYVASFAIGGYTIGLLTVPSFITTGCVPIEAIQEYHYVNMCTGILSDWQGIGLLNFWQAWPVAIAVSALTGMALGVPVLRLRGDYLAIVTLGFGEITRVLIRADVTKPLLGSAQGLKPIPVPVIDLTWLNPEWYFELNNAITIYYLYVFCVLVAAFVVTRLAGARLGRAWRAMRADEDVAEAMGIHLVRTKLMAFGISSAFAGMGGAVFVAQLRGAVPDSFTLAVSINVLSLIIIGGLGSIPGVVVGAFVLVGLPEVLRELQDYRLLAFGALLVIMMLLKPNGLLPPLPRRLSERAAGAKQKVPMQEVASDV